MGWVTGKALILIKKTGLTLILFFLSSVVIADTQQFVDYRHDTASNIFEFYTDQKPEQPSVTNLSSPLVNKESFSFIATNGISLLKADVSLSTFMMALIYITPISKTDIYFMAVTDNTAIAIN